VRVKLVEPGYGPGTRFTENGAARMAGLVTLRYEPLAHRIFAALGTRAAVTREADVADAV
jgi:hypothetical protein